MSLVESTALTPLNTQELKALFCESSDRLRQLFVDTFGPDETVRGIDGEPVKVSTLLQDPGAFDRLTEQRAHNAIVKKA